ncbi:TPA: Rz1-like lysis system protein LysC [Photobacterium damselae]
MTRSSILPLRCKQSLVIICLILSGSLSGCTKSIDRATPVEWVRVFPPPGLLVPCYKPPIKATTPAQLVEEVMRLGHLRQPIPTLRPQTSWRCRTVRRGLRSRGDLEPYTYSGKRPPSTGLRMRKFGERPVWIEPSRQR